MEKYKDKLKSLTVEFSDDFENISVEVFEIMQGDINIDVDFMIQNSTYSERIIVGTEWDINPDVKWYNPFTWVNLFYKKNIYENKKYINMSKILSLYLVSIEKDLISNSESANTYAKNKTQKIKDIFLQKIDEFDNNLKKKIDDLKMCMEDTKVLDKTIRDCENKIKWIKDIKQNLISILDI